MTRIDIPLLLYPYNYTLMSYRTIALGCIKVIAFIKSTVTHKISETNSSFHVK